MENVTQEMKTAMEPQRDELLAVKFVINDIARNQRTFVFENIVGDRRVLTVDGI